MLEGSDYKRPQRPFKNDSFATRGFPTLFFFDPISKYKCCPSISSRMEQSRHYLYLVLCSIHSEVDVEGGGAGDGQCQVGDPRNCVHPGWPGGGLKEGGRR